MSSTSMREGCSTSPTGTADSCSLCHFSEADRQLVVYEDDHWIAYHSKETNILGYIVLKSRRHWLDLSQADDRAAATYGQILRALMCSIRDVTGCARLYTFSLGEAVPHYHLHIVPRTDAMPKAYRARGIMQYPLSPTADPSLVEEACSRIKRALGRQRQSCS